MRKRIIMITIVVCLIGAFVSACMVWHYYESYCVYQKMTNFVGHSKNK